MRIDHAKRGILCKVIPGALILNIVVIKFIAPKIDEAPARCIDNITISTAGPPCPEVESGAYSVQPGPAPPSTKPEPTSRINEGTNNQKLRLFILGNAISGAPMSKGTK